MVDNDIISKREKESKWWANEEPNCFSNIVKNCVCAISGSLKNCMRWIYEALNIWLYSIRGFTWISQTRPLLTKPSTHRKTQKGFRENGGKRKEFQRLRVKNNNTKTTENYTKRVLENSSRTFTCSCINGNAISLHVTSYRSCWGLGWGRCEVYSGLKLHQKATARTDGGCCWPSIVLGLAEAETPSCSGWGWREGSGRTRVAAAVVAAAGMLWLVDCHYSIGLEKDVQILKRDTFFE